MKQHAAFGAIALAALAAIFFAQHRRAQTIVGPDAIVGFIADTERELSRLPASATRMSDAEEIAIGDELVRRYLAREASGPATPMSQYVERVGMAVAARARRKLPYKIHYVDDPYLVNAFALPGGHVFIGAGLVKLMTTEDELAAVLGHEIEHIDHYHCAERYQFEAKLRKLKLGDLAGVAQIPLRIFQAGYTKEQEFEADREGTRLAVMDGYSPLGAVRLFETFDKLAGRRTRPAGTPQEEAARVALGTLAGYFQSHPWPAERAARIRAMIQSEPGWAALVTEKPLAMGGLNAGSPAGGPPMIGTR